MSTDNTSSESEWIRITSRNGFSYLAKRSVVDASGTLKNMLDADSSFQEGLSKVCPIDERPIIVEKLIEYMAFKAHYQKAGPKEDVPVQEFIERIPPELVLELLLAADYQESVLALALLETLVQSCGYPFHLQISTKEFLNELVRRFPERPPPFPGPVMSRILDLIHSWKETICVDSRWKDDLGNIRDMHRLLTFKGYRFRDLPRQQQPQQLSANLKSADELENEDREAQSAKLQELIRRGTPRDLAAAQELMNP
ncbi:hypothetical protein ONZ45_g18638 [Pleurotus djamor]|nr:hypothetical protein ONZ45_g18638 [Pleurotus djamor]